MKPFASDRLALDFSTLYYVSLRTPIHIVNTQLCESCPSKNYYLLLHTRRFFFSFLMDLKKIKWDGFRNQYIYFGNFPHIYIYIYIYIRKFYIRKKRNESSIENYNQHFSSHVKADEGNFRSHVRLRFFALHGHIWCFPILPLGILCACS